jgi:alginate O-acetyltransferase complex protein AlgI
LLFNSFQFLFFIVPVLALYALLDHRRQNWMLLAASYFFYGCWDWRFLGLILMSTTIDYAVARRMADPTTQHRRRWMVASLIINLTVLGFFKYFNFFSQSLHDLLSTVGIQASLPVLDVLLPVGISFYTFQSASYVIDVYRGRTIAATRFDDCALYVSYFPQLVAGPIERSYHLLPQVEQPRKMTLEGFQEGGWLIFWGMFKKVFVADNCALIAQSIFRDGGGDVTGFQYLVGAYAFSWQIYCDFSGYSDIARGLGQMMGFDLMRNFRMPYFSRNIQEFWTRWHISLSTWFKEYVYIPLGGNRVSRQRQAFNLFLVFLISGLWHGAASIYVVWGAVHGVGIVAYTLLKKPIGRAMAVLPAPMRVPVAVFLTFHFVVLAFALWQVPSARAWLDVLHRIFFDFDFATRDLATAGKLGAIVAVPALVQWWQRRSDDPLAPYRWPIPQRAALYVVLLFCLLRFGVFDGAQFIYFQF